MRRKKKFNVNQNSEFELDLAPLLAVMVKLVPVLLLSSAFVQMMVIETELPQVVSQAIQREDNKEKPTTVALEIDPKDGIHIVVTEKGKEKVITVPKKSGEYDYTTLHQKLVDVKKAHPQVFKLELAPDSKVPYAEVVRIMDEARQARDNSVKFPVFDAAQGKDVDTNYMFPEIIFTNMMEG